MNQSRIEAIAGPLASAWREGGTVPLVADDLLPDGLQEAWRIQDALDERLDFELVGWKVGGTSRASMRALGVDHPPFLGRLYREFTKESPARFRLADFRNAPMIEGEFAFRLGRDLPPRDAPYRESEVRDAVSAVIMAVDAVDTRWGVHPFDLPMLLGNADNACAGAFVIGEVLDGWETLDLATLPVTLHLDGEPAGGPPWEGEKRCDLRELYAALTWTANELSRRGLGLRAGEVVSTGSPHEPVAAVAGAQAVIRYGDVGEIRVTFEG
ncbi:MAG: fumarylacetoacetate hydrolase family protein [Immundisolibacterales bacterium]|nr:fumarylacetoacetate hydrolase family protein [Immundisolibacterales bacterium]